MLDVKERRDVPLIGQGMKKLVHDCLFRIVVLFVSHDGTSVQYEASICISKWHRIDERTATSGFIALEGSLDPEKKLECEKEC
eukprot:scaffold207_cov345-Pavlova_lutheri.AAC.5